MSRLESFVGSIYISSGMKPKGEYPLMEAHDIVVDDKDTRLDDKLEGLGKIELDKTLEQEGKAADAKAVGDRITNVVGNIDVLLKLI